MDKQKADRGVFLYDMPTIEKLKSCAFFWKEIIVFESYLSEVADQEDLVEPTRLLLKEGILKICMRQPGELRNNITDKIYCTLDSELLEYIYKNAEKISIIPNLPNNAEQLIQESTKRDSQDQNLKKLMDSITYSSISEKHMEAFRQNERLPFESMPQYIKKRILTEIERITKIEYEHYLKRHAKMRFDFEWRNRYLLEQISVSSALYAPMTRLPFYAYKLGDYSVRDARKYLNGLNAAMPFVKRSAVDSFSFDDIIEIRHRKNWNQAMIRLSELCNDVKSELDEKKFKEEIHSKVILEYQDTLDQKRTTEKDLCKNLAKNLVYTGISLVPIVGPRISAVTENIALIVDYLREQKRQKSLPFFLNDLRNYSRDL